MIDSFAGFPDAVLGAVPNADGGKCGSHIFGILTRLPEALDSDSR